MQKIGILTTLIALAFVSPVLAEGCPNKGGCDGKKSDKQSEASTWNFECGGCGGQKKDSDKKKETSAMSTDSASLSGCCGGDGQKEGDKK